MADPIDFQKFRNDQSDSGKRRLLHIAALRELFSRAHGRPATTMAELHQWASTTNLPRPIDPFKILSAQQIAEVMNEKGGG